jgi:hypothetical protein
MVGFMGRCIADLRLQSIVDVDYTLGLINPGDVDSVPDISEVHIASIFRIEGWVIVRVYI